MEVEPEINHRQVYVILSTVHHVLSLVIVTATTIWYDSYYSSYSTTQYLKFASIFKLFNSWTLVIFDFYLVVALASDVTAWFSTVLEPSFYVYWFKNYLRASAVFPMTLCTLFFYWGFKAVDGKKVILVGEVTLTTLLRHVINTVPTILVLLDIIVCKSAYPNTILGTATIICIFLAYILWVSIVFNYTGVWVLPFMKSTIIIRKSFYLIMFVLTAVFFYFIGKFITGFLWDEKMWGTWSPPRSSKAPMFEENFEIAPPVQKATRSSRFSISFRR